MSLLVTMVGSGVFPRLRMNWLDGWLEESGECMSLMIRSDATKQVVSISAASKLVSGNLIIAAGKHAFAQSQDLVVSGRFLM